MIFVFTLASSTVIWGLLKNVVDLRPFLLEIIVWSTPPTEVDYQIFTFPNLHYNSRSLEAIHFCMCLTSPIWLYIRMVEVTHAKNILWCNFDHIILTHFYHVQAPNLVSLSFLGLRHPLSWVIRQFQLTILHQHRHFSVTNVISLITQTRK